MEARTRTRLVWTALAALAVALVVGNLLFGVKATYPRSGPSPRLSAQPQAASGAAATTVALARRGAALRPVTVPPADTIAGVAVKAGGKGSSWNATFGLYGLGPLRSGKVTVVAKVISAEPRTGTPADLSPLGRNIVLLVPSPKDTAVMKTGGTYAGTLSLELSDGALRFAVRDVQKR